MIAICLFLQETSFVPFGSLQTNILPNLLLFHERNQEKNDTESQKDFRQENKL